MCNLVFETGFNDRVDLLVELEVLSTLINVEGYVFWQVRKFLFKHLFLDFDVKWVLSSPRHDLWYREIEFDLKVVDLDLPSLVLHELLSRNQTDFGFLTICVFLKISPTLLIRVVADRGGIG